MRKFVLYSFIVALFSVVVVGCGGGSTPPKVTGVDPNAPVEKLDPTILKPEFD